LSEKGELTNRVSTIYIDRECRSQGYPELIEDEDALADLGSFYRRPGRQSHGEVGLVVGDEYYAIRDFSED
jgi:hypothetical protein